jgi:hypothetical protein
MDEQERPVTHETTVINTGERGGGAGMVAALVVVVILALAAFLYFGGYLRHVADKTDIDVNVNVPKVELPDIHLDTHPNQPATSQPPAEQPATNQSGK